MHSGGVPTTASTLPLSRASSSASAPCAIGHFLQAFDAGCFEFSDDELHQRIADAAVADRADFFAGQFCPAVDSRPADDELLIDAAGEERRRPLRL